MKKKLKYLGIILLVISTLIITLCWSFKIKLSTELTRNLGTLELLSMAILGYSLKE
ncbi:MAG: hypothetical protein Q4B60_07710 [Erysipelotrichaceae bacterium]|nr:hypothetical protein [Erysipelotrichaceae bacterium]